MTNEIATITGGIMTIPASFLGAKVLGSVGEAAEASGMPDWMRYLLGPMGALIGMIFALWWLAQRLSKAEEKADKREDVRDQERERLIVVIEQNSSVLREVSDVIESLKK